jgi:hypothetical protein
MRRVTQDVPQCSAASAGASPSSHNIAASVVSDFPIIRAVLDVCDFEFTSHVYVMLTRDDEPLCSARPPDLIMRGGPRHDF